MSFLWLQNARIIDPATQRDELGDLFVADGIIASELTPKQKESATCIDLTGKIVCPGFVDLNVHLREPGDNHKETIATGTQAAAQGGYTSIVCMSNTKPPADNAGTVQLIKDAIQRDACVNVFPTGCMTLGREGKQLAPTGSLKKAGVVAVTDGGHCIQNTEIMRRAIEYADMFELPIIDHCQDITLTDNAVMNEGEWSLRLGLRGMPKAAEDIMVARDVILSTHTQAHIHIQHVSSAYSMDVIRRAKQRNIRVTAEATPHHLALNDSCLRDYNTHFKMLPPLREEADRQATIEALLDGTLDVIATAHAPHSNTEKDCEFDYAPFGIIGLETAFSVCYQTLVQDQHCELPFLISRMTHKPAEILGLNKGTLAPGADADIAVIDLNKTWTVAPHTLSSMSQNSPWLGQTLPAVVDMTFVGGKQVYCRVEA